MTASLKPKHVNQGKQLKNIQIMYKYFLQCFYFVNVSVNANMTM